MCGIAGYLSLPGGDAAHSQDLLFSMSGALQHRGPDGAGIWSHPSRRVSLSHRRLAILGLGRAGEQPMRSQDGRFIITFNGEIYNYLELADELALESQSLLRCSDTAVLLEGFSRWGVSETLRRAVGMFALAVWDDRRSELFLARDPAGKKPLYYARFGGALYFASELVAFRQTPGFDLSLREDQLWHYLSFGYVPSPGTIYSGIFMLSPGDVVRVPLSLEMSSEPYHRFRQAVHRSPSAVLVEEELEALLSEAVRVRLRSDVPLGCFLSGGIDSGLLVALASRHSSKPLRTFTIQVNTRAGAGAEGPLAMETAKRYGTHHEQIEIAPEMDAVLPRVAAAYGQPFADPSAVPSFVISEEARKHVSVIITGDGADEVFGGYRRQSVYAWAERLSGLSGIAPAAARFVVSVLPTPVGYRSSYAWMHRFLRGLSTGREDRYFQYCMDGFSENEKRALWLGKPGESSLTLIQKRMEKFRDRSERELMLAMDFYLNLHDDMLVKIDIATMAHSLEARCPLLDVRVVDWAFSLPFERKIHGCTTKPLLRALARRLLPRSVAIAPKRGFEIPISEWLRRDLKSLSRESILNSRGKVRELFSTSALEHLLENKDRMDPDRWARRVWTLLMLALWSDAR